MSSAVLALNLLDNEKCVESNTADEEDKKIIYLTFDDGPSYKITNKVLDVLEENQVKATFFLIGSQIKDKEDVVKRIYNEGHSIGLHTYTHNFRKIYCNEDKFIQEMMVCRNEIQEVIGIAPNIIRFPGGSYKHLSKSYLKKLHDNNFRVYDWNMDNCDGLNPKSQPYNLYVKAIKGSDKFDNIILLLHCTDMNKNTCKALPEIIKYYKSQGYEFKGITDETAELYFPIKK
jgi:peptidoglycan/xylan/chitin deacetylase (PgdA/CDA1 family)